MVTTWERSTIAPQGPMELPTWCGPPPPAARPAPPPPKDRFAFDAPPDLVAWDCDCSICAMKRNTHAIVPEARFRLLQGEESLSRYQVRRRP